MSRGNWFLILPIALVTAGGCTCNKGGAAKQGPFVAEGKGVAVTVEEFKTKLDEQSRFSRPRLNSPEGKKEVLDSVINFELLVREARAQKIDQDPEVQAALDKILVQKLVRKSLDETNSQVQVSDDEAKVFYTGHINEFVKPERVGVAHIFFKAPLGSPDRVRKAEDAKKAYIRVKTEEVKDPVAFPTIARQISEDDATKGVGGDLGFKSRDDLEKQFTKPVADAVFALRDIGAETAVVESPMGFHIFRLTSRLPAFNSSFDQAKSQIVARMGREKRSQEFQEWTKKLREEAGVKVDEAELEKVQVAVTPPPGVPQVIPSAPGPGQPIVIPGPPPPTAHK
jgi:peptidyl-prolyl cis-trans isomerase C